MSIVYDRIFQYGLFDTAIVFGEKAILEFQHLKDTQNSASCLNLLGGITGIKEI
jgi:hypothetical protein